MTDPIDPEDVPFEPVPDSDHLPDEVKNGEVPGDPEPPEDDPAIPQEDPTEENT